MSNFVSNGSYDNVLTTFGWYKIDMLLPLYVNLEANFIESKYVLAIEHEIEATSIMRCPDFSKFLGKSLGKMMMYRTDTWKYTEYYLCKDKPNQTKAK